MKKVVFLALTLMLTIACNDSNGSNLKNDDDGKRGSRGSELQAVKMPVDWNSVPEKFHPEIVEEQFNVADLSYIDLNILGISNEVNVSLSRSLTDTGKLKIYRVWAMYANLGRIDLDASFDRLEIGNYTGGQPYSCSKSISNRKLVRVEGGCNLYVELVLPQNSEIEVYSGGKLVSKRYFPMTYVQLMEKIDTGFNDEKLKEVENFLASYTVTQKTLKLSSLELEEILKEFTFTDKYKFSALKKLYRFVTDSEGLNAVIENSFLFHSDREKDRRIVGLR